jgi:hypothetical protein
MTEKLIIFIDEIQNIIGYKQQNSFIGFIKSLSQSDRPVALRRLAFVLLGVARPTDLVTDYKVALNLGERIELGGLQESNCNPLWQGLEDVTDDPANSPLLHLRLDGRATISYSGSLSLSCRGT